MKKFEYLVTDVNGNTTHTDMMMQDMDAYGRDGWELVSIVLDTLDDVPYYRAFFKRPLEE